MLRRRLLLSALGAALFNFTWLNPIRMDLFNRDLHPKFTDQIANGERHCDSDRPAIRSERTESRHRC